MKEPFILLRVIGACWRSWTWLIVVSCLWQIPHPTTFAESEKTVPKSFYDLNATLVDGKEFAFKELKGNVVLVVNVASRCGFTSQYKDLSKIHAKYAAQGFEILGFPSNQFSQQEPGTNAEIKKFCEDNYAVKFKIFQKSDVNGEQRQPTYEFLLKNAPQKMRDDIGWNFVKFLVNRKGEVVDRFSSMVNPSGSRMTKRIEELLAEKAPE